MVFLNRTCYRIGGIRRCRLAILVLLSNVFSTASASLQAEPVMFQFEATVASSFPTDGGANLPFVISPGDSIVTTLTFQSGTDGPVYPQSSAIRFDIDGVVLQVAEYQILVDDNGQVWIDHPGRIADPNNTPDVDINAVGDNIVASCLEDESDFCGTVSNGLVFRPLIVFTDFDPSLLASDDLLPDSNIWNAFSLREMSLLFQNVGSEGTTYVGAHVGPVQVVPEPSAAGLLLVTVCTLATFIVLKILVRLIYHPRTGALRSE